MGRVSVLPVVTLRDAGINRAAICHLEKGTYPHSHLRRSRLSDIDEHPAIIVHPETKTHSDDSRGLRSEPMRAPY